MVTSTVEEPAVHRRRCELERVRLFSRDVMLAPG